MEKETKKVRIFYGASHSKTYTKSVVSDFLVDKDKENGFTKYHSDVNLLLRQQSLHKKIGVDLLRDYVNGLEISERDKHDFTDDELFSLIEPKEINNLTTAYEYAKYLKKNSDDIKKRYKDMKKAKDDYDSYVKMFHNKDKD